MGEISPNMTVHEVAVALNKGEQFVRLGLQQKRLPFGVAVYNEETKTWNYHISRAGFYKYQHQYIPEVLKKI